MSADVDMPAEAQCKCSLCGFEFSVQEGRLDCGKCPLNHRCALVRCPNCSYEMLAPRGKHKEPK